MNDNDPNTNIYDHDNDGISDAVDFDVDNDGVDNWNDVGENGEDLSLSLIHI